MNLYRDGQFLETYREARSYDLLTFYISKHAEPTSLPTLPETTEDPIVAPIITAAPEPEVQFEVQQQQQRENHQASVPAKDLNVDGKVLALDDKTFRDAVNEGHVFVKFYAPWYVSLVSPVHLSHKCSNIGAVTAKSWHPSGHNSPPRCSTN